MDQCLAVADEWREGMLRSSPICFSWTGWSARLLLLGERTSRDHVLEGSHGRTEVPLFRSGRTITPDLILPLRKAIWTHTRCCESAVSNK